MSGAAEELAVRSVVLDYVEGWFDGDAGRMERALHPELVKRCRGIEGDDPDALETLSAREMIDATAGVSNHRRVPWLKLEELRRVGAWVQARDHAGPTSGIHGACLVSLGGCEVLVAIKERVDVCHCGDPFM